MQSLSFIYADINFFFRLATLNKKFDNKIALLALKFLENFKFIYYISYIIDIYYLYILFLVAIKVIIITYERSHSDFLQYYEIILQFYYICGLIKLLKFFICYYP